MKRSKLEIELEAQLRGAGIGWVEEFKFCPWRMWRSDFRVWQARAQLGEYFAREDDQLLVEVQGHGPQGRHGGWHHMESDAEKFSTAAALGWRVLPVTGKMVHDGRALRLIEAALGIKPLEPPAPSVRPKRSQAVRKPNRWRGLPDRVGRAAGLP